MFKKLIVLLLSFGIMLIPNGANASSHAKSLKNLGMNEIMFAQMMIPHHEQAISISETALKKSRNQAILKLSRQIKSLQSSEKNQLSYWLKATGSSMTMDHDMKMSGMLTIKELASLKRLTGTDFDRTFLQLMIKHHQGALEMLDLISDSKNLEAKALAKAIKSAQSKEITSMQQLLNTLK
ncbi:MAG: hypothetical protein RIQ92_23 [Actinomycetota bacterium]|jgi:uncharacterized protein (DUF305 family)